MRKGMMLGSGKRGYYNLIPKDPRVHSDSARGMKQAYRLNYLTNHSTHTQSQLDLDWSRWVTTLRKRKVFTPYTSHPDVWVEGRSIIKKRKWLIAAKTECEITNLLASKIPYYPECELKRHDLRWYVVVKKVEGVENQRPIQFLTDTQKNQLAWTTRLLYLHKYVDYDGKNDNVIIDKNGNAVWVDFDNAVKVNDDRYRDTQYNLNILSIFGIRNYDKAKEYMTMTREQLLGDTK